MSTAGADLCKILSGKIKDEDSPRIKDSALLFPIAKAFLEKFPQYYDIITTYENAVEAISDIVGKEAVLDSFIQINDNTQVNFKLKITNVRIYRPDTLEAAEFSNFGYIPTPNAALAIRSLYSAVVVGDVTFSYTMYNIPNSFDSYIEYVSQIEENANQTAYETTISNGYCVNVPIPIGCKWCALRNYDPTTLIQTAEELTSLFGYFIVDGYFRNIIPIYKKPFNKPIILKNDFEDQLSRTEVIYTKGYEYEESYFMVGAMVVPKNAHVGRGGNQVAPPDFGFSLQLQHPAMNVELNPGSKRSHKLYNFVPIKFLFVAFGCITDEDMLRYICPQMNDFGLINAITYACLQGYKHHEAIQIASLKLKPNSQYIVYDEPLTEFIAKYVIGMIILSDKTKQDLLARCNHNIDNFKLLVVQTVTAIFNERFMPGIGDPSTGSKVDRNTAVCVELGSIIQKLYLVGYGLEPSQDKTSLCNRRVRNGQQISREFKAFHKVRLREILEDVKKVFMDRKDPAMISSILMNRMQTLCKNISMDQSISLINSFKGTSKEQSKLRTDLMVPKNQAFVWNHTREIVISSEQKAVGSTVSWDHRTVHQSELFFICPTQTPESGGQTGRFKTPTLFTYVTLSTKGFKLIELVQSHKDYITNIATSSNQESLYTIRMNGSVIGYIPEYEPIESLYEKLMLARLDGIIEVDASIILNHNLSRLDLWTDTGRLVSPFVRVKDCFDIKISSDGDNLKSEISVKPEFAQWLKECSVKINLFDQGIRKHFIEFMDAEMCINNAVIAPSLPEFYAKPITYTHIALPQHLYGIIAGIVPAINTDTGVRASYLTNHIKQAIGPIMRYPQLKYVKENNIGIAPQIPLVRPCVFDYLHLNEKPIGQNVIVAFMQYKYNQEDAIIMNQASVESGLLKIDSLCMHYSKIEKNEEEFRIPPAGVVLNGNPDSYAKIDIASALPKNIGEIFYQNDCLIAKINKTPDGVSDSSILNEKPDGKYPVSANPRPLRSVVRNKIHQNNKTMKMVMFGQYRVPILGDKFNPDHCQKGTCGCIMPPEDMPYTTNGIKPDIIFNPPSIFKRKTYGHLLIAALAKLSALLGCPIDCTPFHTFRSVDDIYALMKQLGLDEAGYETMYDAHTGRPYKCKIFVSNHYWERQSHLVEQKLNIRNGGRRDWVTGQPAKGRRHGGGQTLDKMGYDCTIASGLGELLLDMHLNQGSKIKVGFCNRCHTTMAYLHKETNMWTCPRCGPNQDIKPKEIPPGSAMLVHILNGLHVGVDYYERYESIQ